MSAGDNSYQSVTFLIDLHDASLKQQQRKNCMSCRDVVHCESSVSYCVSVSHKMQKF